MMPVNSNPTVRPGVADVDAAFRYPRTCKGGMPHTHNNFSTAPQEANVTSATYVS